MPAGPYLDKDGKDMAEGGGSLFLKTDGRFIGPGHAGISELEEGKYCLTFHFYDGEENGVPTLGIRELIWENGWPVVTEYGFEFYGWNLRSVSSRSIQELLIHSIYSTTNGL